MIWLKYKCVKGSLFKTKKILKANYNRLFRFEINFVVHLILYFLIFLANTPTKYGYNTKKIVKHYAPYDKSSFLA